MKKFTKIKELKNKYIDYRVTTIGVVILVFLFIELIYVIQNGEFIY